MDRRVRKTRSAIKNTLLGLMEKDDAAKITVTEICNIIDINRGTFYLHYDGIPAVLSEIEDELLDSIKETVITYNHRGMNILFSELDKHIRKHKQIYVVLSSGYTDHFISKLTEEMSLLFSQMTGDPNQYSKMQESQNYISVFLIAGGIGVILEWLRNDCSPPLPVLLRDFVSFFNFQNS